MTDERKKFLASISREEKVIRLTISILKEYIGIGKERMKFGDSKSLERVSIRNLRIEIKSLKKQLPAPRIPLELNEVVFPCACSVCKYPFAEDSYCPCCGQKLR